ncbi:hypothetical protein JDV02_004586 [Purpureocillium takamizusanense]|uniref:Cytochrome P450 n=1 Tax=Purpureocillium takamizusanense TaxID=2060973 RepID=A0A9Q8QFJ6_9HYPO|nr:uncharacterized protein JDV02_004586 [Purpureocillium takamizusanense]UNI18312.1 hypothetical protein JDV02_004586 [Purpureocillium takamizusanense]
MAPAMWVWPDVCRCNDVVLFATISAVLIIVIAQTYTSSVRYPRNLPRIGRRPGQTGFSLATRWQYLVDCSSLYRDAYENYSKKGKTVLIPGLGARDEIILPGNAIRWALAQPEEILSSSEALVEINQTRWAFGNSSITSDLWHVGLFRTDLNRALETVCAGVNDELALALDTFFGVDADNWTEIDLLATMRMVVAQAGNRFIIGDSPEGLKLCRDQEFLRNNVAVFECFILNGGISGACPVLLRPLVGRMAAWPIWRRMAKFRRHIRLLYEERMRILRLQQQQDNNPGKATPRDFFQVMMQFAATYRTEDVNDFENMAARLCAANFGAMHQTSIQATNLLLNILGSDPEFDTIAVLRDEVARVIGPGGSPGHADHTGSSRAWTKAKVAAMVHTDSAARETLRINAFANRAIFRKVMVDGLTTEDGISLPKGSFVSFFSQPPNTDSEYYEEPLKFDPFRFSRSMNGAAGGDAANNKDPSAGEAGGPKYVSTSERYLSFGHGKHACPGRFLVDFELKMMVACILTRYDIKLPAAYQGRRPRGRWVAEAHLPPHGARIMVKRRRIVE